MSELYFVFFVIFMAFVFDFINGFHDAANSIATIVATEVLTPNMAVLWAAFFNAIAFLFIQLKVAKTIGTGLILPEAIDAHVILAALTGAIIFNLCTWYFGLPSSSSHALIGGLVGAASMSGGFGVLQWGGLLPFIISIVVSPILGMVFALLFIKLVSKCMNIFGPRLFPRQGKSLQLISSALLSLSHGGNDAQKTMGIIAILLFSQHLIGPEFHVPTWVMISCNLVIALGTFAGGWRIVHTLGHKITQLNPIKGACVETAAAITLFSATYLGIPVSTTHTVTGSVIGAGASEGKSATNWDIIIKILWAWVFTLPVSGLVSAFIMFINQDVFHLNLTMQAGSLNFG